MPGFELPPLGELGGVGTRVVESQSQVATNALVDDLEEQRLLEELLEDSKPRTLPPGAHYLISTPFRYPPLRYGSRFGTTDQRGVFYGSERLETALAETAFYALLFLEHAVDLDTLTVDKTAFTFGYATDRGLDTLATTFDAFREGLEAPGDYTLCQRIGRAFRAAGGEVLRFRSVRCPAAGTNLAVFTLDALEPEPRSFGSWQMVVRDARVDFIERNVTRPRRLSFAAADFAARGVAAHPGG